MLVGVFSGELDSVVLRIIPLDPVATSEAPLSDQGEIASNVRERFAVPRVCDK